MVREKKSPKEGASSKWTRVGELKENVLKCTGTGGRRSRLPRRKLDPGSKRGDGEYNQGDIQPSALPSHLNINAGTEKIRGGAQKRIIGPNL